MHTARYLGLSCVLGLTLAIAFLCSQNIVEHGSFENGRDVLVSVNAGQANADIDRAEHVLDSAATIPKGPLSHVKKGSKYSQELAALARRAEPDRKAALAKLDELRRRSEGGKSSSGGASNKHKIPAALIEMENLAHRRTPMSSGVAGLGKLARSHGIESSKKMLAEIMSLRHYKQSNNEINDIANGFEAHSSISHRFKKHIDRHLAAKNARQERIKREKAAAALRLEAGRVTRSQMKRSIATNVEQNIGTALERTFKPMQKILGKDERTLDKLLAPGAERAEDDRLADKQADHLRSDLMNEMKKEVGRVLVAKETELEHKSSTYIAKVHEKALQTLDTVVNPDSIGKSSLTMAQKDAIQTVQIAPSAPRAISWSKKVADFLKSTQKFILSEQDHNANRPLSFNAAIQATQGELEQQLKSVKLTAHTSHKISSPTQRVAHQRSSRTAAENKSGSDHKDEAKSSKLMSPQQKSAFKKALDSYL